MKKEPAAKDPETYVAGLSAWRRECVERLRDAVTSAAPFAEVIKWGHLVYLANGPAALIRAEPDRVLFGLWRGQRLRAIAPRLEPGGKYEMARLDFRQGDAIDVEAIGRLAAEAFRLNAELGDPTDLTA